MAEFTAEEMAKLPKWAQLKAHTIMRGRDTWRDRCLHTEGQVENPAVFVWEHTDFEHDERPIGGEGTRVRFRYGRNQDYFEAHIDKMGRLNVRTAGAAIAIRPQVSNDVTIEAVDRT